MKRTLYRTCDVRWPFLWVDAGQPDARWHGSGEGPCHYLATSAKGAWAEVLRHREIDEVNDLLNLELVIWEVEASIPAARPKLPEATMTGDETTYPSCQREARRLRSAGATGLVAPSAALKSGEAEIYGVGPGGQTIVGHVTSEVVVIFGQPDGLRGMPLAEGHPDPSWLGDVRHF